jgi:Nif-specific regulatory protein
VLSAYFEVDAAADFEGRLKVLEVVASQISQALRATDVVGQRGAESQAPERSSRAVFEYSNMIGASAVMRQVYEQIGQVARTTATVLIRGESGTGKELVAEAIHGNSPRVRMPFIRVNCAALPETLF